MRRPAAAPSRWSSKSSHRLPAGGQSTLPRSASSGSRKTLPAEARTALGFQALTVPGRLRTPSRRRPRPSAESCPGCRGPASRPGRNQRRGFSGRQQSAQVQFGGSTRAATGCGVSVASAESSNSLGSSSTSVSAGRLSLQQMLRSLCHKDAIDAQAGAQGLFEQIRPFDSGQAAAARGRDGPARGANPSGGNSVYSVQCEKASGRTLARLADSKPFCPAGAVECTRAELHHRLVL